VSSSNLVSLPTEICDPRYFHNSIPGARRECRLATEAAKRLCTARQHLANLGSVNHEHGLLIWDGHRTIETQRAIFDRYARQLADELGVSLLESAKLAEVYVSAPDSTFPHGTGGAVDLTLTINGRPAPMGTNFDEFTPRAASDWYFANPPDDMPSHQALANRALLHFVMTAAGFVAYPEEWWHFEWGTRRWASTTGGDLVLDQILHAPPPLS
jgi:D-alanyl-D-alanine dipeptidase